MSLREPGTPQNRLRLETLAIAAFGALLLFVVFYALSQRQQVLRASPSGFDGLQTWLASEGVSAQSFLGGWQVDQNSVGLLLLPLYDTVPDSPRSHPATKTELLFQQDEYDLEMEAVLEKTRRVQTLAVLPKWRSGMRLAGVAHPVLLNDRSAAEKLLQAMTGQTGAKIVDAGVPFSDFSYTAESGQAMFARVYAAQMFTSPGCTPLIGTQDAMLLADCSVSKGKALSKTKGMRLLLLSDPDLLNNHGLRMADNAAIARDLLAARAGGRNVMIDYSRGMWLTDPDRGVRRERSWADLKRFFEPPFNILWLGGSLTLGLFVWRSWLRYGPVRHESAAASSGKALALQARARLMRLCNQDGALVSDYAHARLAATAAALFGPAHSRHYAEPKAFLGYVARRHPGRAAALESVLTAIQSLQPRISPAEAIQHVDELEALLEQIIHDT
ncbi:hypothetical protein KUW17_19730 [Leisingera aquaemixtae]|uniref:hypothetical protein n=1 Tax=Leisingera aquaemixtae TaxID=1396826 RepID=UPI001C96841F|nr:hypothetical protein [Leisingera aquaemixtae]MBY6068982.1 hypothetical protein [Leisingera aquaemixtae]